MNLKIQVILSGKKYDLDLERDLEINSTKINSELAEQPSKYAWYGVLSEFARATSTELKQKLDTLWSELYLAVRKQAVEEGLKLTEETVSSMVRTDKRYQELEQQYLEAKKQEQLLLVARQAFEHRKDMLISLASNLRAEADLDLKVLKEKVSEKMKSIKNGGVK